MRTLVSFSLVNEIGGTAAAVTDRLGLAPSRSREAGATIALSLNRVATHSSWVLSSAPEPEDGVRLSGMLARLLDQLTPLADRLWDLDREGYRATWLCMLDIQDGEAATELPRETLRRLLELPGELWLDVYRDGDADPAAASNIRSVRDFTDTER